MKKILSFALSLLLIAGLAACGAGTVTPDPTEIPTEEPTAIPTAEPTAAPTPEPTAEPTPAPTPEPEAKYNEHDMEMILAFLETKDADGVTNGAKCFEGYDPEDPETWHAEYANINWSNGSEMRLVEIGIGFRAVVGTLDVSGCTELRELTCWSSECNIDRINASGCTKLKELNCNDCYTVREIILTGCTALNDLQFECNLVESIDLTGLSSITQIFCPENRLEELDVSDCVNLKTLNCSRNRLKTLDLSALNGLKEVYCSQNKIKKLDLSGNSGLKYLACGNNKLTELKLGGCTALVELSAENNSLSSIDVTACAALDSLDVRNNSLTVLDLSGNPVLWTLYSSGNRLTKLDLMNNNMLSFRYVAVSGNGTIGYDINYRQETEEDTLYAVAGEGAVFLGWYTEDGQLISTNPTLSAWESTTPRVVAKFS